MGSSGSYGGSGGKDWSRFRQDVDDWLNTLPEPEKKSPNEDKSITKDDKDSQPKDDQDTSPDEKANEQDPAATQMLESFRRAFRSGSRGTADGPSSGGGLGQGGGVRRSSRSPSGSGRSIARASKVGGTVLSGVSGIRSGNAAALRSIGLDLAELESLNPYQQAQRLFQVAIETDAVTTLEDDELQLAANRTAIWALKREQETDARSLVRRFVVEYVNEVFHTESGAVLRSGERDGVVAVSMEDRVRNTIEASVRNTPLDKVTLDAKSLGTAIQLVLNQVFEIHGSPTEK